MSTQTLTRTVLAFSLACSPALFAGCGDNQLVNGNATVDHRSSALSAGTPSILHGYYTNCLLHNDNETWAVNFGPTSGSTLKVVQNNVPCKLTITALDLSTGPASFITYLPTAPILLTSNPSASMAFAVPGGAVNFYLSAWLSSATFASNFQIILQHSEDPINNLTTKMAAFVVTGTVTAVSVAAPTYTLNLNNLVVYKDGSTVFSFSGNAVFGMSGPAPAQDYFIMKGVACPATLGALNTAHSNAMRTPLGMPPNGTDFGLVAQTTVLPYTSCLVLDNCANDVCSYTTFSVTFQ